MLPYQLEACQFYNNILKVEWHLCIELNAKLQNIKYCKILEVQILHDKSVCLVLMTYNFHQWSFHVVAVCGFGFNGSIPVLGSFPGILVSSNNKISIVWPSKIFSHPGYWGVTSVITKWWMYSFRANIICLHLGSIRS